MTIIVTKRGSLPDDRYHDLTCRYCQTEFTFQKSDATHVPDQREGDYLTIECPVCRKALTKAL